MARTLPNLQKIVIKIGSSCITSPSGRLDRSQMARLVREISEVKKRGHEIIIVSSGAIAAGVESLDLKKRPREIPKLQAAAAVGQGLLMHMYSTLFSQQGIGVGQILLTQEDTTRRQQYINAKNTISTLLKFGVIPIINENDSVAVEEIKFGDNDTLAALVSSLANADLLVILSDIEGLCSMDPHLCDHPKIISEVEEISPEIEEIAGGAGSGRSRGGMVTKIQAARIATFSSIGVIIADGRKEGILEEILAGKEVGTYFKPRKEKVASLKRWIAFGRQCRGKIVIDPGAVKAIREDGRSLLPVGILQVEGEFESGDNVDLTDGEGKLVARGVTNFSHQEVRRIAGLRSEEIIRKYGRDYGSEVVHRDLMVVF